MDIDSMNKVIDIFKNRDNFLLTAHVNPEGDSIGSQIAVYHILKHLGKNVIMVDHDKVPDNLRFLPGSGLIMTEIPGGASPETVVMLDCPVKERAGNLCRSLKDAQLVVNIDHHISNEFFGDVNWVEPEASSVGEMIFRLCKKIGMEINEDLAKVIYTAIVTDTGMFNYDNTSRETHEIAGELISRGVNPREIHSEIFESKSLHDVRLLGRALTTLRLEENGALSHMSLTRQMFAEEEAEVISTDEFINFPRSIKGVEIAVFFKEDSGDSGRTHVSFRSTGRVNVNALASRFGGGGHELASGCVLNCGIDEARDKVLAEARKILKRGE